MPWGFRVRNSAGAIILDVTDRITRFVGTFSVTTADSGTFTDAALIGGSAWILPTGPFRVPVCTFNSSTGVISWNWDGLPATYRSAIAFRYGLY